MVIFRIGYSILLVLLFQVISKGQITPEALQEYVQTQYIESSCEERDTFYNYNHFWGRMDAPNEAYRVANCFYSSGMFDSVVVYLNRAIDDGLRYRDSTMIYRDNLILEFQDDINFDQLLISNSSVIHFDSLRNVLLSLRERDQVCRGYTIQLDDEEWESQKRIDFLNQQILNDIIRIIGKWPGVAEVGKDGASVARLIALHADRHPTFQKNCLELMFRELSAKNVNFQNFAMLYDRWLLSETGKQLFGTQIERKNGIFSPKELVAMKKDVDWIRDFFLMPPLSLSMSRINEYYQNK